MSQQRCSQHSCVRLLAFAFSCLLLPTMDNQSLANGIKPTQAGITYAKTNKTPLLLDLYIPEDRTEASPLLIWVHGGAWRSGTRAGVPVTGLLNHGIAIASIDYRLSGDAAFPAQIHDINRAIYYLRQHSDELGIDPEHFAIAGSSAGGHLAALTGVSHDVQSLTAQSTGGKSLQPKSLQPKSLKSLQPKSLKPKSLKPKSLKQSFRFLVRPTLKRFCNNRHHTD